MKRLLVSLGLVLAMLLPAAAQSPDDLYLQIYNLIQDGDSLRQNGNGGQALARYQDAQARLNTYKQAYPESNREAVAYRSTYVAGRIAELSVHSPAGTNAPAGSPGASAASAAASADLENQVRALQQQVRQLSSDNDVLQAKLKEAFSVQPAKVDPQALAKAQERGDTLERENSLLKVSLAEAQKKKPAPAPESSTVASLRKENIRLQKQLEDAQAQAAQATRAAQNGQDARVATLQSDNQSLRLENTALQTRVKQLAEANRAPVVPVAPVVTTNPADTARIRQLERERDDLQHQLAAAIADARKSRAPAALVVPVVTTNPADTARIRQLEHERDDLQHQLAVATKDAKDAKDARKNKPKADPAEVRALRDKLAVYEAQKVSYTPAELALLKSGTTAPKAPPATAAATAKVAPAAADDPPANATPVASAPALRELPPGGAALVAEADRLFAARQYEQAEAKYLEVLRLDEKNVNTLANLATIQMEANHYDGADQHLKQALALAPDDTYALTILGNLRFRQGRYDEAVDALSRAAKLDPQGAAIQNFLGLSLSQKGLRKPAEAALRKAIQLDPNYADAQNNLAVFYATDRPPLIELARSHYEKALSLGHPQNPELEKMLNPMK